MTGLQAIYCRLVLVLSQDVLIVLYFPTAHDGMHRVSLASILNSPFITALPCTQTVPVCLFDVCPLLSGAGTECDRPLWMWSWLIPQLQLSGSVSAHEDFTEFLGDAEIGACNRVSY